MRPAAVECLRCGHRRRSGTSQLKAVTAGACPRCGYLGWAPVEDLSDEERRGLREVPLEERRFRRTRVPR